MYQRFSPWGFMLFVWPEQSVGSKFRCFCFSFEFGAGERDEYLRHKESKRTGTTGKDIIRCSVCRFRTRIYKAWFSHICIYETWFSETVTGNPGNICGSFCVLFLCHCSYSVSSSYHGAIIIPDFWGWRICSLLPFCQVQRVLPRCWGRGIRPFAVSWHSRL